MPTPEEILAILKQTSNDLILLAILFHILVLVFAAALIKGWRPSTRFAGLALSVPVLSVSLIAWTYANPFNGAVFGTLFILLCAIALRLPGKTVVISNGLWRIAAVMLITFGIFYPHFLDAAPVMYLIAAPTGLIPCPTLSVVVGFTLLFQSFNSVRWAFVLAFIGLFYGVFGAARLHVSIDVILSIGSLLLVVYALTRRADHRVAGP